MAFGWAIGWFFWKEKVMEGTRWSRFFQNRFIGLALRLLGALAFGVAVLVAADMRNVGLENRIVELETQMAAINDSALEAAVKEIRDGVRCISGA